MPNKLYNDWAEAEATIDIAGKMVNLRFPSKIALAGALSHLGIETNYIFMRNACKSKPINYVVDVGASVGGTALLFAWAFPSARILAIEPMTINYNCLLHNIKDFPQITSLQMAAHSKRDEIRLSMPTPGQRPDIHARFANSGLFSIHGKDMEHSAVVQADVLDDIVDDKVDFLKIDVEGAEASVLAGATRIMAEDRPILMIELRKTNMKMAGKALQEYHAYFKAIEYKQVALYIGDVILVPSESFMDCAWTKP
jgi:FkbM family methyltransferase